MAKMGRKTLFRDYMYDEAYRLGALGLTMEEVADFWNVSRMTLQRWAKNKPDFRYTIKKGKEEADQTVIQALLKQANEGNITGIIFWLKNRQRAKWRDVQRVEGTLEVSGFLKKVIEKAALSGEWRSETGTIDIKQSGRSIPLELSQDSE